jgi:hypothetical protein
LVPGRTILTDNRSIYEVFVDCGVSIFEGLQTKQFFLILIKLNIKIQLNKTYFRNKHRNVNRKLYRCSFIFLLKAGTEESIVNAPRITA